MTAAARSALAFALAFATAAAAQGDPHEQDRAEMARAQRELQRNRAEVERLIDLRLRHDLGLPGDGDDSQFKPATPMTPDAVERARQELRDQDLQTASLLERYNKLRSLVDQLRSDAAARAAAQRPSQEFVVVPQPGTAQPGRRDPVAAVEGAQPAAGGTASAQPAAPPPAAADGASRAVAATIVANLDPIKGQIHGTTDHQRVAQSLYKAGQALMDLAAGQRAQGQDQIAAEYDARAKERLLRALDELAPLLQQPEPTFAALLYQGRCRELLFRVSERYEGLSVNRSPRDWQRREQEVREPFLAISARDVTRKGPRGEIEVLGPWGLAAQAAMEQFRWMNLHAGFKPRTPIESITWERVEGQ
jgi:hypothetical protein